MLALPLSEALRQYDSKGLAKTGRLLLLLRACSALAVEDWGCLYSSVVGVVCLAERRQGAAWWGVGRAHSLTAPPVHEPRTKPRERHTLLLQRWRTGGARTPRRSVWCDTMAMGMATQRLRTAAALHITGCVAVAGTCVAVGCAGGSRDAAQTAHRSGGLTARVWGAAPKTVTDYWRLHYNIKVACFSASENA